MSEAARHCSRRVRLVEAGDSHRRRAPRRDAARTRARLRCPRSWRSAPPSWRPTHTRRVLPGGPGGGPGLRARPPGLSGLSGTHAGGAAAAPAGLARPPSVALAHARCLATAVATPPAPPSSRQAWVAARKASDFSAFAPYLQQWVDVALAKAAAIDPSRPPYDVRRAAQRRRGRARRAARSRLGAFAAAQGPRAFARSLRP